MLIDEDEEGDGWTSGSARRPADGEVQSEKWSDDTDYVIANLLHSHTPNSQPNPLWPVLCYHTIERKTDQQHSEHSPYR